MGDARRSGIAVVRLDYMDRHRFGRTISLARRFLVFAGSDHDPWLCRWRTFCPRVAQPDPRYRRISRRRHDGSAARPVDGLEPARRGCGQSRLPHHPANGTGHLRTIVEVLLPASVPSIVAGLRVAAGLGWQSLVGAELIVAATGVGFMMVQAQANVSTPTVIAGMFAIGIAGMLIDVLLRQGEALIRRRRGLAA